MWHPHNVFCYVDLQLNECKTFKSMKRAIDSRIWYAGEGKMIWKLQSVSFWRRMGYRFLFEWKKCKIDGSEGFAMYWNNFKNRKLIFSKDQRRDDFSRIWVSFSANDQSCLDTLKERQYLGGYMFVQKEFVFRFI